MSNINRPSVPHACYKCKGTEFHKIRKGGDTYWQCKCGVNWKAHNQEWDKPPEFVRGRKVFKRNGGRHAG